MPETRGWVGHKLDVLRHYHEVAEVGEIARRYFAMNAFDGVLTTMGVLIGSYIGKVHSAKAVASIALGAAVAMGVSGAYGSFLIERAERGRALKELEESTLSSLGGSDIAAASTYATVFIAAVDGLSPFLASLLMLVPFLFTASIGIHAAYFLGTAVGFVELFLLGMFLGRVSRERLLVSGVRLAAAGVISLALSLVLDLGLRP
jgi:predicted membrane protein (TIGR00267 family)